MFADLPHPSELLAFAGPLQKRVNFFGDVSDIDQRRNWGGSMLVDHRPAIGIYR